jgi:hypothetical protein
MTCRVYLDTNIVSRLAHPPATLAEAKAVNALARRGDVTLVVSPMVEAELHRTHNETRREMLGALVSRLPTHLTTPPPRRPDRGSRDGDARRGPDGPDELDLFEQRAFATWDRESLAELQRAIRRRRRELAGH